MMGMGSPVPSSVAGEKCLVDIQSVLRLRPLLRKERDDQIILEEHQYSTTSNKNKPALATLHPLHHGLPLSSPDSHGGARNRRESDIRGSSAPQDFHFSNVLPPPTSQEKLYYTVGLPMATKSMEALAKSGKRDNNKFKHAHLLICMGVVNSGNTYSCIGNIPVAKRRSAHDGLVPRLTDSLFSQSKRHNTTKGRFTIKISVIQVTQANGSDPHDCCVQDLLADSASSTATSAAANPMRSPSPKRSVRSPSPIRSVRSMASKIKSPLQFFTDVTELDADDLRPTMRTARDEAEARDILQSGLNRGRRAARGHHKHHLFITIQPVLNGSHHGDTIAFLDMAGLEKGKRSKNRGKETVHNNNQAANSAVLHCLRTMLQNTSIRLGTHQHLDIGAPVDDTTSEISCVSQAKDPYQKRYKTVPFRQHKVTMLLSPLLSTSKSASICMLVAAYPGHVDYFEKKSLLQNVELVCGSSILANGAAVSTGLHTEDDQSVSGESVASDRSDDSSIVQRVHHVQKHPQQHEQPRRPKAKTIPSTLQSKRNDKEKLSKSRHFKVSPSVPITASAPTVEVEDEVTLPPPFAPSYRPTPFNPEYKNQDSAHKMNKPRSASPVVLRQPKKKVLPSDFPGVVLPPGREHVRLEPSTIVGGRRAGAPPSGSMSYGTNKSTRGIEYDGRRNPTSGDIPVLRESSRHNIHESHQPKHREDDPNEPENASRPAQHYASMSTQNLWKSPIKTLNALKRSGKNVMATVSDYGISSAAYKSKFAKSRSPGPETFAAKSPREDIPASYPRSDTEQSTVPVEIEEHIRDLEDEVRNLREAKRSLEDECMELQAENSKLRHGMQNCSCARGNYQHSPKRSPRRNDVPGRGQRDGSVWEHMKKTNRVFDIKNQCFETKKPHFDLDLPQTFERAAALNERDKAAGFRSKADFRPPVKKTVPKKSYIRKKTVVTQFSKLKRLSREFETKRTQHSYRT